MQVTNYLPMQLMSNTMYELYVGFSSTHPDAERWVDKRKGFWREALGEPFVVLLDKLTHDRIAVDTGDTMCDLSAEFKALDELAIIAGKRPPGWVASGTTDAFLQAPNLPTMLVWLREYMLKFNTGDDALLPVSIDWMMRELTDSLPNFGETDQPWVAVIDSDFESNGYKPEFVPSNVSDAVFVVDCDSTPDPYYVNGPTVQFCCPMGFVTIYQGVL